jgi:REP element-mobilizing transposase RayT
LHQRWREELRLEGQSAQPPPASATAEERRRIEEYLNEGIGPTWLSDWQIGDLVEGALLFFDGSRYRLHAWVVMPNHVHVVITPFPDMSISQIVSSWKSYTATRANALLKRQGAFWQADYFDRFIRDERRFLAADSYIENNPVVARLCPTPEKWRFSSAWRRATL